ncbi:two-component sensor histidine kinase [Acetobacter orientalis]|uniref:Two-component sensor histidine kinase n=1 Tax=Acetobacter orientalis TaxID=146474 RepID=A0A2Z5ZG77_9PROT|nr:two-component sensor histidine kinase [Acetobacter orientalis]
MARFFSSLRAVLSKTRLNWLLRSLERSSVALTLAALALGLGFATFVVLSGGMSFGHYAVLEPVVVVLNSLVLCLLLVAIVMRIGPMVAEHRKGLAGARLHVRLVTLFGIVAVAPPLWWVRLRPCFSIMVFKSGFQTGLIPHSTRRWRHRAGI